MAQMTGKWIDAGLRKVKLGLQSENTDVDDRSTERTLYLNMEPGNKAAD